jgi:hypothetical protein
MQPMNSADLALEVARFVWLAMPVVVAAVVHLAVLRLRWLEPLRIPLDGGATFRGQRLFGDNKTVRGAVVMLAVSAAVMPLQGVYRVPALEFFDYGLVNLPLTGALLGAGFVLGELPNSFLKRQLRVPPGGHGGVWHAILDQLDSVIGALLLLSFVWVAPPHVWAIAFLLGSGLHMAVNGVFVLVGVKRTIF